MAKRKHGVCIYCGRASKVTRDHVPPKQLFRVPRPSNLITVPSCFECNQGFMQDDEYFAHMLSLEESAFRHPDAAARAVAVLSDLNRPDRARTRAAFQASLLRADVVSAGGIFLRKQLGCTIEYERIRRVTERCVKGLFAHETGGPFPSELAALVLPLDGQPEDLERDMVKWVNAIASEAVHDFGNGVFSYAAKSSSDNPRVRGYVLQFYRAKSFLGATIPKADYDAITSRPRNPDLSGIW